MFHSLINVVMLKKDTLTHYKETHQIEWANTLPENCPPEDILVPEDEEFFRLLINQDQIVEDDWKPYTELYPNKTYVGEQLLNANGLSITKGGDFKELTKPVYMKKKFKGIAKIKLNPTDGVLKKTGADNNHYTWWRTTSFDTSTAEIIKNEET